MEVIYVQIPAYRDSELEPTLIDIFKKCSNPERIRICVVWQHAKDEILTSKIYNNPQIEIIDVPFEESKGCNWARNILQKNWKGETYTLLLDSHHRFVKDWDIKLIEMYNGLKTSGIQKPLITAYLPSYNPENEPRGRLKQPLKIRPLRWDEGILTHLSGFKIPLWTWLKKPIIAEYISLHFIFTEGVFNEEVFFDDEIYFFGDEVFTSLKAFTKGYDFFHPHYVIGWHLYNRKSRITHWSDHSEWHEKK